ncbi:MAG: fimbrial biogenesis outer membrane usher protein [Deltaproteobacteria bacterium]|nr:fimbrial biogenesis outer membrane usher protein [Deltaproteobacteria bacterium]
MWRYLPINSTFAASLMLIHQCVTSRPALRAVLLLISFVFISLSGMFPGASFASETIIVNVVLNQVPKGEFFVTLADDGDFLIKTSDLQSMGVSGPFLPSVTIEGESYVSLKSFSDVSFVFDEKKLSLEITAAPKLLPKQILDFAPQEPLKVYYPKDSSAFLNYRLDYLTGDSFTFEGFNCTNELGVRIDDFLLLSDSVFTENQDTSRFIRLSSRVIFDRRPEMQRLILGDFTATSGNLGTDLILGGISFSKVYNINPYFINRPTAGFSGLVPLPSDLEVYLNGSRIRTERLAPGEFELRNITGYGGESAVQVIVRDPFGREQLINYPFYFTDITLKKGLHEYSYNFGAIREDYGVAGNSYGKPAFSGFHNYGYSDFLTLGLRGEWAGSAFTMGSQVSFLFPTAGTVTAALSGSYDEKNNSGVAGLLGWSFQGENDVSARLFVKGVSRDYATIDPIASTLKTEYEADAGIGYSNSILGSFNLDFASYRSYEEDSTRTVTASYSRNLTNNINLNASFRRNLAPTAENEFYLSINYYPGRQINLSTNFRKAGEVHTESLVLQKNQPIGEGLGCNVALERTDADSYDVTRVNPSIRYNAPFGVYAVDYSWLDTNSGSSQYSRFSASGAIAYLGNTLGMIRPVSDSFALVQVGEVAGVGVNLNNQLMARTNSSGKAFIPDLGSFNYNQVSVTDKDIPMDYLLSAKLKYISPPFRSGSCVNFDAPKVQAITGSVSARIGSEMKPLEYDEISVTVDGRPVTLQTGSGGEFYLDNYSLGGTDGPDSQDLGCSALGKAGASSFKPGTYTASVLHEGRSCTFSFEIPQSYEMILELGQVTCQFPPRNDSPQLLQQ